jgi:hypothetical protein
LTDDRQRYRHHFRCRACATRFHVDRLTADPNKVNPKCPKKGCLGKVKQSFQDDVGMDVGAGKAPGVVGANIQTMAYDAAMNIAMSDHSMTDIQDHSRPGAIYRSGEATAPKLPMHLQAQADGFWKGPQKQRPLTLKPDLSPIFGGGPQQAAQPGNFSASVPSAIAPILSARPAGSSPVPNHRVIADDPAPFSRRG